MTFASGSLTRNETKTKTKEKHAHSLLRTYNVLWSSTLPRSSSFSPLPRYIFIFCRVKAFTLRYVNRNGDVPSRNLSSRRGHDKLCIISPHADEPHRKKGGGGGFAERGMFQLAAGRNPSLETVSLRRSENDPSTLVKFPLAPPLPFAVVNNGSKDPQSSPSPTPLLVPPLF